MYQKHEWALTWLIVFAAIIMGFSLFGRIIAW